MSVPQGTLTPRFNVSWPYQPTPVTHWWDSLSFNGPAPVEKIRATDAIFGMALAPSESPSWGFDIARGIPQTRSAWQTPKHGDFTTDGVSLQLQPAYATQWPEIEEILERCAGGQMIIAVPDSSRQPIFIGRTHINWGYRSTWLSITDLQLPIEPLVPGLWIP